MNPRIGSPLRLLKTMRGEGALVWGKRGFRRVNYCLDLYGHGRILSGDGDMRGDLADLVGRIPLNARLRLAGGEEVRIAFCDIDAEVASIELLAPMSAGLAPESAQIPALVAS
jgi:hypothetical protein